ncbi:hypothetical protein Tco_1372788 [Tanacetum coccineum]
MSKTHRKIPPHPQPPTGSFSGKSLLHEALAVFSPSLQDMFSTAFIEPLPVIEFVTLLLNMDTSARPLCDSDRAKVRFFVQ